MTVTNKFLLVVVIIVGLIFTSAIVQKFIAPDKLRFVSDEERSIMEETKPTEAQITASSVPITTGDDQTQPETAVAASEGAPQPSAETPAEVPPAPAAQPEAEEVPAQQTTPAQAPSPPPQGEELTPAPAQAQAETGAEEAPAAEETPQEEPVQAETPAPAAVAAAEEPPAPPAEEAPVEAEQSAPPADQPAAVVAQAEEAKAEESAPPAEAAAPAPAPAEVEPAQPAEPAQPEAPAAEAQEEAAAPAEPPAPEPVIPEETITPPEEPPPPPPPAPVVVTPVAPPEPKDIWTRDESGDRTHKTKESIENKDGMITYYYYLKHLGNIMPSVPSDPQGKITLGQNDVNQLLNQLKTPEYLGPPELGGTITYYPDRAMLKIYIPEDYLPRMKKILEIYDSPPEQVEIYSKIAEFTKREGIQWGTKWDVQRTDRSDSLFGSFETQFDPVSLFGMFTSSQTSTNQTGTLSINNLNTNANIHFEAVLKALETSGIANITSEPSLTLMMGQTGKIMTGFEVPITQAVIVNNQVTTNIVFKKIGNSLWVTPLIIGDETVQLHVVLESSQITGYTEPVQLGGFSVSNPIISTRNAEVTVEVPFDQLLIIGGLEGKEEIRSETGIPFLKDVPILGFLFKSHTTSVVNTDLNFFLQPKRTRTIFVPKGLPLPK